jgi:hypothetical protein
MTAFSWISPSLAEEGQPAERLRGIAATSDFFTALGVQPLLGRVPTSEEAEDTISRVVVLSHSFWSRRFGGDPNILGSMRRLNGENSTVIGVMPAGFEHPLLWGSRSVVTAHISAEQSAGARQQLDAGIWQTEARHWLSLRKSQ